MPRPVRLYASAPRWRVIELYEEGLSTRTIARKLRTGRWYVEECLTRARTPRRDREEAVYGAAWMREVQAETGPQPCVWPDCDASRNGSGVCAEHRVVVDGLDGRICRWPATWGRWCGQPARAGLCFAHRKRVESLSR